MKIIFSSLPNSKLDDSVGYMFLRIILGTMEVVVVELVVLGDLVILVALVVQEDLVGLENQLDLVVREDRLHRVVHLQLLATLVVPLFLAHLEILEIQVVHLVLVALVNPEDLVHLIQGVDSNKLLLVAVQVVLEAYNKMGRKEGHTRLDSYLNT